MFRKNKEELRRIQELRRSNAASAVKSGRVYSRQSNKKLIELSLKERNERE